MNSTQTLTNNPAVSSLEKRNIAVDIEPEWNTEGATEVYNLVPLTQINNASAQTNNIHFPRHKKDT